MAPITLSMSAEVLRDRRLSSLRRVLFVVAEVVVALALWEVAVGVFVIVNPIFFPPPSAVLAGFLRLVGSGVLLENAVYSFQNFAVGYALGASAGITCGLLLGSSYVLGKLLAPIAWTLYAFPQVAIRPMTTIWFGFGAAPIIFLVFLASFFPVLLNTMSGVRTVDPTLLRAGRVFGARRWELWWKIMLPATVPFVLTGLRLAVVSGFIGLLVSELVGSPRGFGALISISSSRYLVNEAFAVIMVLVTCTTVLVRLVGSVETRLSVWRT